jgi:hypothetical protein
MTTMHITLDEHAAEIIRKKAQLAGKTAEEWLAEMAVSQAVPPQNKGWIDMFLESARNRPGNSHGWKWNREELYER